MQIFPQKGQKDRFLTLSFLMEGPGDIAPRPRELHHPDYLADGVYQALDLTVGLFRG